jgi:hypothetical protein
MAGEPTSRKGRKVVIQPHTDDDGCLLHPPPSLPLTCARPFGIAAPFGTAAPFDTAAREYEPYDDDDYRHESEDQPSVRYGWLVFSWRRAELAGAFAYGT